jgi:trk system potassium uptake protein
MYIIIGGGGDIGYYLTKALLNRGHEVLLLEKDPARLQTLKDELGQAIALGDACEARTMEEVGANRADVVIAVTGHDEDNLVICQMAKRYFKVDRIIARLNNPKHEALFQRLGIVPLSPTKAILSLVEAELPSSHFVSLITLRNAGLEVIEMRIPADSPVVGKALRDINLPRSCNLALLIRNKESIIPSAETVMKAGDDVFALASREGEEALRQTFGVMD